MKSQGSNRTSETRFHTVFLFMGLAFMPALHAQTSVTGTSLTSSGSVIDDAVLYHIGGGTAVPMSQTGNMSSIGISLGWKNPICGNMDLTQTLKNQLNGSTTGFKQIMSTVVQSASAAVASLPAIIIQRADPALYNLLTNGVLQARLDFDRSKLTCRAIASQMSNIAGGNFSLSQLSEGFSLQQSVLNTGDAVSAIQTTESSHGNNGVPWVGGTSAGGSGQNPMSFVGDVTRAGYNLLNGRSVTDTSSMDQALCNNSLTCQTWQSPDAAAAWAVRVLGDNQQQTCDGCTTTQTTPGVGLAPLIQQTYGTKLQSLQALVNGTQPITPDNLQAAGSSGMPITRGVIEALRDEQDRGILTQRLASEVALSTVLEQALTLQRTLLTGSQEPNIAANKVAQQAVSHESDVLEREIQNLKSELEVRRELSANSPMAIIQRERERSDASHGIYQGDPTRDRLDQVQKQGGTTY